MSGLTTTKSAIDAMGTLKHLPLYWDDVKDDSARKRAFDAVFGTEGMGYGRLNPDGSQKERAEWQTMLVMSSNESFISYVVKKHKTHAGGLVRVFECKTDKPPDDAPGVIGDTEATLVIQECESNYGLMGIEYAKFLAANPDGIADFVLATCQKFERVAQPGVDERFWTAACGALLSGAALANKLGVNINVPRLWDYLIKEFYENRKRRTEENLEGGGVDHTTNALSGFLNIYNAQNAVWTNVAHMTQGKPKPGVIELLHYPQPYDKPIFIHWAVQDRLLRVTRSEFIKYLEVNGLQTRDIIDGLKTHYGAKSAEGRLCGGTKFVQGPQSLIHIPVPPGSVWEDIMLRFGGRDETIPAAPDLPSSAPVQSPADAMQAARDKAESVRKFVEGRT